jgi:hypothetical protein
MRIVPETDLDGVNIERPPPLFDQSILVISWSRLICDDTRETVGVSGQACMSDRSLLTASGMTLCFFAIDIAQEWRDVRSVP